LTVPDCLLAKQTIRELRDLADFSVFHLLLFSRFRPKLGFGRPMGGGHVLLNFNEVHVRG